MKAWSRFYAVEVAVEEVPFLASISRLETCRKVKLALDLITASLVSSHSYSFTHNIHASRMATPHAHRWVIIGVPLAHAKLPAGDITVH